MGPNSSSALENENMGLWDKLRGELIDIIEWIDGDGDVLVHRFERYGNEIKYGAKLVVREGQAAVFINEGALADVFEPGTYTLETKNLPILATLKGWKYGFESPFKAEVYFVKTKRMTDLKWGTKNPIMLRDAEFGPLRLRAFGTYVAKVKDPATFIREVVGTDGSFTPEEITSQLRNYLVSRFADVLGESRIPALDLAANYVELGDFVREKIAPQFEGYGVELIDFLVENISLPEVVEKALDDRTKMGVIGNLNAYTQLKAADAIEKAATTEGGLGGQLMGWGVGMGLAGQMGRTMMGGQNAGAAAPPPLATPAFWVAVNGQQTGPFDMQTLAAQVQAGRLTAESLVWCQGMAEWKPASQVPALQRLFGATPPPPPPPPPAPPQG